MKPVRVDLVKLKLSKETNHQPTWSIKLFLWLSCPSPSTLHPMVWPPSTRLSRPPNWRISSVESTTTELKSHLTESTLLEGSRSSSLVWGQDTNHYINYLDLLPSLIEAFSPAGTREMSFSLALASSFLAHVPVRLIISWPLGFSTLFLRSRSLPTLALFVEKFEGQHSGCIIQIKLKFSCFLMEL